MNRRLLINASFSGLWKSCSLIIKIIPATVGRSTLFRVFSHCYFIWCPREPGRRAGQGRAPSLWRGRLCELLAQSSELAWAGSQGSDFRFTSCQDSWWSLSALLKCSPILHFSLFLQYARQVGGLCGCATPTKWMGV